MNNSYLHFYMVLLMTNGWLIKFKDYDFDKWQFDVDAYRNVSHPL